MTVACDVCQLDVEAHDSAQGAACLAQMLGVPVPADQAGEAATAAYSAAREDLADFVAWVEDGVEFLGRLWDSCTAADSLALVDVLRRLTDREAGLVPALQMLQRRLEDTLGARHGRRAITDGDGTPVAQVDRQAGSTKWDVERAWPDVIGAVRKADRLVIDADAGELEDDTARALRIVRQLCGISYLKVEACKQLDLDPDDYREKGNYRWVVKLP